MDIIEDDDDLLELASNVLELVGKFHFDDADANLVVQTATQFLFASAGTRRLWKLQVDADTIATINEWSTIWSAAKSAKDKLENPKRVDVCEEVAEFCKKVSEVVDVERLLNKYLIELVSRPGVSLDSFRARADELELPKAATEIISSSRIIDRAVSTGAKILEGKAPGLLQLSNVMEESVTVVPSLSSSPPFVSSIAKIKDAFEVAMADAISPTTVGKGAATGFLGKYEAAFDGVCKWNFTKCMWMKDDTQNADMEDDMTSMKHFVNSAPSKLRLLSELDRQIKGKTTPFLDAEKLQSIKDAAALVKVVTELMKQVVIRASSIMVANSVLQGDKALVKATKAYVKQHLGSTEKDWPEALVKQMRALDGDEIVTPSGPDTASPSPSVRGAPGDGEGLEEPPKKKFKRRGGAVSQP